MCQSWAITVDKLIQGEIAVEHVLVVFLDVDRDVFEELSLDLAQSFGSCPATPRQCRIGFTPLPQFRRPLPLSRTHLVDQLFEHLVLPLLTDNELLEQGCHFRISFFVLIDQIGFGSVGADVNAKDRWNLLRLLSHEGGTPEEGGDSADGKRLSFEAE